jgi:hypothetical protein
VPVQATTSGDGIKISANPEVQSSLSQRLADLADCAGEHCRSAEDARLERPWDVAEVNNNARP